MSRISDTRFRTREAAAQLLSKGKHAHELTVDLIYAEIKQGSRTTINDELKIWKQEQAKNNALNAELPAAVANAMLNTWAIAVEYGEQAYAQAREVLENELAAALAINRITENELTSKQAQVQELAGQIQALQAETKALTTQCLTEQAATASARQQNTQLIEQSHAQQSEYETRITALQTALQHQEQVYHQEIEKTVVRLEGVQQHMMLQVTEAREVSKKLEAQLEKALQKNAELQTALTTETQARQKLLQQLDSLELRASKAELSLQQKLAEAQRFKPFRAKQAGL